MSTFELAALLKKLTPPMEVPNNHISVAVYANKKRFTAIGHGIYRLCPAFYQQFLDGSPNHE